MVGVTVPVAVGTLLAQSEVALAAPADDGQADVAVTVSAPRHILAASGGWTTVTVQVSNLGTVAATGVTFSVTLPPELRVSGTSGTSQWDCSNSGQTYTCAFVGDLAAGATPYGLSLTANVVGAAEGSSSEVTAETSTTSPEANLANNQAQQELDYVGKGMITTHFWNDLNADGLWEQGEPTVDPGSITFNSIDDQDQYGAANTFNGVYSETVVAKTYYAEVQVRTNQWQFTKPNAGDDSTDSDFTQTSENTYYRTARTEPFVVDANGSVTVDVGLVAVTAGS
jgi:uncharacterized repeat protein (TIGR01451 family)